MKTKRFIPALVALVLLLALVGVAPVAAKPNHCERKPNHPKCTRNTTTTTQPVTTVPTTAPATTAPAQPTTTIAQPAPTTTQQTTTTTPPTTQQSTTTTEVPSGVVRDWGEVNHADWARVFGLPQSDLLWTWQSYPSGSNELDDVQLLGGDVVRQRFVPNVGRSDTGTPNQQVVFRLDPARKYTISQEVLFEPGWSWGKDSRDSNQLGKIGLGVLGGSHASGGSGASDGYSSRFMWYPSNTLSAYHYHADRSQRWPYGDQATAGQLSVGVWHSMTMEVVANSSTGAADGSLRVWLDGELTRELTGLRWMDSGGSTDIDQLTYASFFGGWGDKYAPPTTVYAQLRNFQVVAG